MNELLMSNILVILKVHEPVFSRMLLQPRIKFLNVSSSMVLFYF